jgi:dihydroorotase
VSTGREGYDLVVRGGTVVTGDGRTRADIGIRDGTIALVAAPGELGGAAKSGLDASGRFVIPGVIDGHVHFRDPGYEYKEDFLTGSRAAVMGGVTTVLDMPNTDPQTKSLEAARRKKEIAERKAYCDFGLIGLLVSENVGELAPMAEAGLVVGFKAFLGITIGGIPAPTDGAILDGMREVKRLGLRLGFHAENNDILQTEIRKLQEAGRTDPLAHLESRPVIAELESIQRMGLFARETGCPVHIFHLSSGPGLEMIEEWRAKGVDYTCETGPHYCFLTSADMKTLGPVLRMNPPVREPGHGDVLLRGLAQGRITGIATDHSPHTHEEKLDPDIWKAISGFAGVETSVRLFLTYGVNAGRLTLEQYVRAASEGPAKTWGLWPRKGAIQAGSDADLTILDLEAPGVIREADLHGKNNITPFEGHRTKGAAVATIVRGAVVMRDGEPLGQPGFGRLLSPRAHAGR